MFNIWKVTYCFEFDLKVSVSVLVLNSPFLFCIATLALVYRLQIDIVG